MTEKTTANTDTLNWDTLGSAYKNKYIKWAIYLIDRGYIDEHDFDDDMDKVARSIFEKEVENFKKQQSEINGTD